MQAEPRCPVDPGAVTGRFCLHHDRPPVASAR